MKIEFALEELLTLQAALLGQAFFADKKSMTYDGEERAMLNRHKIDCLNLAEKLQNWLRSN